MEKITINEHEYLTQKGEFAIKPHQEYNTLKIYPKVGELERVIGLLNDLTENKDDTSIAIYGWKYGGFVPIGCSKEYKNVYVYTDKKLTLHDNIPSNIHFNKEPSSPVFAVYVDDDTEQIPLTIKSYLLTPAHFQIKSSIKIKLHDSPLTLYVPSTEYRDFYSRFYYYFEDGKFKYDNLIHLCIMVKNAGPLFEKVLTENLPIIDRWTILDTGSTDGTQDIVRKVLANKKGELFEESFINFRDSRNRCFDLAGKKCKYYLMLDDTYVIQNNLRTFLSIIRGDQFASSYSLLIKSDDTEYYSNRITMPERCLRYMYTIHEVIQYENNINNVVIPKNDGYILDYRADYMEKRTMDRKRYDLKLLYEMVEEDPTNPRHYYYLAQTYILLEDYENAAFWFHKRATTKLKGHDQEVYDSWFELGRTYNFKLNKPWEECKKCYEEAYRFEPTRPESLYFIGIHYYLENDELSAYHYFKKAFNIGYPIHCQFSLKPTLSFHFLPKFFTELCYKYKDWQLGLKSAELYLMHNKPDADRYYIVSCWYRIHQLLCTLPQVTPFLKKPIKPIIVFVADGGWGPWTGSDILTKGVGGSETYIIEIARWVQASGRYDCFVFCKCSNPEVFEGVRYLDLKDYPEFIANNQVHTSIVSRYSEYVPLTLEGNVLNVHLVLHDLGPTCNVIPFNDKFRKVICLTDWHKQLFSSEFPQLQDRADYFYYGIDANLFKPAEKVKNSFIYSSFPNRGLLPLLQMWPKIKQAIPDATLNVYSDINGKWVNEVAKDQMDIIRQLLAKGMDGVTVHGWVSKKDLAAAWGRAEFWLYPCIFKETFCLTALEAAATKTLAIGPPLAALGETIGDRGLLIPGNPLEQEWQDTALNELLAVLNDTGKRNSLIESNYKWAQATTWQKRGEEFMNRYLQIATELDSGNMYNWVHDIPINERKLFEEALKIANPKLVLEIGTYTGTSLIEMLKLYPEAHGVAIDTWKNYDETGQLILKEMEENNIERIFYDNVKNAGISDRVEAYNSDSVQQLAKFIKQNREFDFIYVDAGHKCLDCYGDMILAWQLLRRGGVMAVDDIKYNEDRVQNGEVLEWPKRAKEHFEEKFKGEYEVISDEYRWFIKKL